MATKLFTAKRLIRFTESVLTALGVERQQASVAAQRIIEADLRGMHGHGIFRLPSYCRRIEEGGYNLAAKIRIERETPVSALVDGDNGLGQAVVSFAADVAIRKAKENGMAWVGIHGSNHAGAGGVYAAMSIPHDLISMYMAIGNANHMPPWGGVEPLLSTNPIAFAIPAGSEPPVILDMATTAASYGKVKVTAARGEQLPVGWMADRKGKPLTDPSRIHEGHLLPIGEHKGYGLSLVVGALAGVLNGGAFGSAVVDFNKDFHSPTNSGQLYFAMRPDLFRDLSGFKSEMDLRIREIRRSEPIEGGDAVRIPGEMAGRRQEQMLSEGVPVASEVVEQLRKMAARLNLEDRLELP